MRRIPILLTAITAIISAGCRKSTDNPVPRPVAYPRIEVYKPVYDTIDTVGVLLPVNKGATRSIRPNGDGNTWIDVTYPRYRAILRYTLSDHDRATLAKAIDNRLTRMSLNSGGNTTEIIELQSLDGISSTIFVTPGATVTPVQILSTDSTSFLLSGVLEISGDSVTREEISPVVSAVKEDMLYTAKHISHR